MSARASAAKLAQATKDLSIHWQETLGSWRDAKAREFGENYLASVEHEVARTTHVMEEIDSLLRKVRADCE